MNYQTCWKCRRDIPIAKASAHFRRVHTEERIHPLYLGRGETIFTSRQVSIRTAPKRIESTCMICFSIHNYRIIPCNHTDTCLTCLDRWWIGRTAPPICPMCRGTAERVVEGV